VGIPGWEHRRRHGGRVEPTGMGTRRLPACAGCVAPPATRAAGHGRINMPSTEDHLHQAFAGESQANRKYLAFAEQAERDGFPNIARLFRTTAEAETIHALGHLRALGEVGSTAGNLESAIAGETYEYREMYPPMLEQAIADRHPARRMFGYAVEAEEVHARLYSMALEAARQGKDLETTEFYLCPVCGHIELGAPPEQCPICKALGSKFVQV
jgi:rubrerythrin